MADDEPAGAANGTSGAEARRATANRTSGAEADGAEADADAQSEAERVTRAYFAAIDAHDVETAVGMWAPGGRERVLGLLDAAAPEGVRGFIGELLGV
ncbi:MAG: hypothetical protein ACYCX7_11520, partial [Solirubrobacteraceae bacterium]